MGVRTSGALMFYLLVRILDDELGDGVLSR
jgi:hypothetical protein